VFVSSVLLLKFSVGAANEFPGLPGEHNCSTRKANQKLTGTPTDIDIVKDL